MGFKCAPQILGLVRGEPKHGAKHRANGGPICKEAGEERASRSATLDRTRSCLNGYDGYTSGTVCWDDMCETAGNYKIKGKTKDGKEYQRDLRGDAVIGYALIFNPPMEMTKGWTEDDFFRFYMDSWGAMCKIQPKLFRKNMDNARMIVTHQDEGMSADDQHMHIIGDAVNAEGRYCGNLIDAKLCNTIAKNYPRIMREKGWDLDDLDITDWERYHSDPEYKAERDMKRKQFGRDVNEYIESKLEAKDKEADVRLDNAKRMEKEAQRRNASLDAREARLKAQEDAFETQKAETSSELQNELKKAQRRNASLDAREARLKAQEDGFEVQKGKILSELQNELKKAQNYVNAADSFTARIEKSHPNMAKQFRQFMSSTSEMGRSVANASRIIKDIPDCMKSPAEEGSYYSL